MADYTLSAKITATAESFEKAFSSAEKAVSSLGESLESAGQKITSAATKIGTALGGVAAAAVKVGSDFEAQMSRVEAISGATGKELDDLREQALELGADTAFSASEAAEGMENLAAAGFETTEIMDAMPGLLDLAAASGEDLASSSDIAASTLRGFGLEASEAAHVADVLAENANRTNSSVTETGEAMKYIAPMARACGISMEETAAAIGLMANAGIQGSQAGTTLRGALSRLSKPTDAMITAMDELGVSFYDSDGKMKSLSEQVAMLEGAMTGLTDEERNNYLVTLYGQEALSGMLALIQTGSGDLDALTASFESCDGSAAATAATMRDNLQGSVEELGGSLETLGIHIYDSFSEPLQDAVGKATESINQITDAFAAGGFAGVVDELKEMSPTLDTVITKVEQVAGLLGDLGIEPGQFIAAAAAAGPVLTILGKISGVAGSMIGIFGSLSGGIGTISTKMGAFAASMRVAGSGGTVLSGILTTLTSPIGIVLTAVTAVAAAIAYLMVTNDGFRESVMGTVSTIGSALMPVLTSLGSLLASVGGVVLSLINSVLQQLAPVLAQIIGFVGELVAAIAPLIVQLIDSVAPVIMTIISTVSEIINALMPPLIAIIGIVMEVVESLIPPIQRILSVAVEVINSVIAAISPIIGIIADTISSIISIIAPIITFVANVITEIINFVSPIVSVFAAIFEAVFETVSSIFSDIGAFISDIFDDVEAAWDGLTGFVEGIFEGISDAFDALVETVKGVINGVIGAINGAIWVINKIPGVEIGEIPYLAHGTENWQGGFAYMNEGGRGELTYLPNGAQVIPHDISVRYAKEAARANAAAESLDMYVLGNYIVEAVARQGAQIAAGVQDGIGGMRLVADGRETARFVAGLGFVRG